MSQLYFDLVIWFTFCGREETGGEAVAHEELDLVAGLAQDGHGLLVRCAQQRLAVNLDNSLSDLNKTIV